MRRQSIFQSTKQIVQGSADLLVDSTTLLRKELQATTTLNEVENSTEIKEAKLNAVGIEAQLAVDAYSQIAQLQAMDLPEPIKAKLIAKLEATISE